MSRFKWLNLVLPGLILLSCGKSLPELEALDATVWKNDTNGCNAKRMVMADALIQEKNKLLALDELAIVSLLGRPDRNELYKRNQKFYYYFLEPSEECPTPNKDARKLVIRFNAMGLAKEILVE